MYIYIYAKCQYKLLKTRLISLSLFTHKKKITKNVNTNVSFIPISPYNKKTQFQTTKKTSIICTKNFIGSIKANILLLLNISPQKNLSLYYLPLFRFFFSNNAIKNNSSNKICSFLLPFVKRFKPGLLNNN